jgi:hypothetical protein
MTFLRLSRHTEIVSRLPVIFMLIDMKLHHLVQMSPKVDIAPIYCTVVNMLYAETYKEDKLRCLIGVLEPPTLNQVLANQRGPRQLQRRLATT